MEVSEKLEEMILIKSFPLDRKKSRSAWNDVVDLSKKINDQTMSFN